MRPPYQMFLFLGLGSVVWGLAHWYMAKRLIPPRFAYRHWAWTAMGVLLLTGPAVMGVGRFLAPSPALAFARWAGFLFLGSSTVLFALVVARDLVWLTGVGLTVLYRRTRAPSSEPADPMRRAFLFNATSAAVVATAAGCSGLGVLTARTPPKLHVVEVAIAGLHPDLDGLRIAHLSDIHVGPTIDGTDLAQMVAQVNAEQVDLIAVTGDLVDGYVPDLAADVAPLGDLRAPLGVFYCTGNHEYYWDAPAWCDEVQRLGLTVLNNAHHVVQRGAGRLLIAGVTDFRAGAMVPGHATDPQMAAAGAPEVDFRLMLAHQPKSVYEVAKAGFDLQLSGHTHGGQYFPYNLLAGAVHPYFVGLNEHAGTKLFISTGAGVWGPPNRLGVPREIPIVTLRRA